MEGGGEEVTEVEDMVVWREVAGAGNVKGFVVVSSHAFVKTVILQKLV
jgi:hypothetical protein